MLPSTTFDLRWIRADLEATTGHRGGLKVDFEDLYKTLQSCDPAKIVILRLGFDSGRKPKEWVYTKSLFNDAVIQTMHTGKGDPKELTSSQIVRNYGAMIRHVMDHQRPETIYIEVNPCLNGSLVGRGIMVALMQPNMFTHSKNETPYYGPQRVVLHYASPLGYKYSLPYEEAVRDGLRLGRGANLMRRLAGYPLNVLTIDRFAELIKMEAEKMLSVGVSELPEEVVIKMGLLTNVCVGSGRQPRVIELRVDPESGATEEVDVDVVKCLMFDDGGPNHKGSHVSGMQADMSAGAMELAKLITLSGHYRHKLTRSHIAIFMIAENRIGPDSYMHGDVLTAYDGRRVEVQNTDAEGRLVLADGIAYAREHYRKIHRLTTYATLTGAVIAAIGEERSGLMVKGNNRRMTDAFERAGEKEGDLMHALYVDAADSTWMESIVADVKNVSGKPMRGSQTGAAFLWEFLFPPGTPEKVINADKTEVVHVDMARVCTGSGPNQAAGVPISAALWWSLKAQYIEFQHEPVTVPDGDSDPETAVS